VLLILNAGGLERWPGLPDYTREKRMGRWFQRDLSVKNLEPRAFRAPYITKILFFQCVWLLHSYRAICCVWMWQLRRNEREVAAICPHFWILSWFV